jgi:redox-sensitive bicupin YhaK (pirin superfamily)
MASAPRVRTVTYIIDGILAAAHRVAAGAAGGKRGLFHGLQLWVNLPRADKWLEPTYRTKGAAESTLLTTPDGGALIRMIAGEVAGHTGPGSAFTPITTIHATIAPGAALAARLQRAGLRAVRDRHGGPVACPVHTGQATLSGPGDTVTVAADHLQESRHAGLGAILLGGRPIREPVAWAGPFVMNTRAEVLQAFEAYQQGPVVG